MEKTIATTQLNKDFANSLLTNQDYSGDLKFDLPTRLLYSTDASIYSIEPLGVAYPRKSDDLAVLVETALKFHVPVLPRGSGSSLAGQAIGPALIIDCSKFLTQIIDINPEEKTATVEPGVILSALNRSLSKYKLQFGPDPASADRATIGGCIANNATGAHSIVYGMSADHILSTDVILSDGSQANLQSIQVKQAEKIAENNETVLSRIYRTTLRIRTDCEQEIKGNWPKTWRRASGYNLNYLLPWSPSLPPFWDNLNPYPPINSKEINLAPLMAGSEGTLAVFQRIKLRLVSKPSHTILAVIGYPSIEDACDAIPGLFSHHPTAIELIPQSLVELARSVPAYARQTLFLNQLNKNGNPPSALLVIEFSGEDPGYCSERAAKLGRNVIIADTAEAQKHVWGVRKAGLGILMSLPTHKKPVAFVEDTAVPVDKLGEFVREVEQITRDHGTFAEFYAHASAGCLHIRPVLDLKSDQGRKDLRSIAERVVEATLKFGGAVSAEHGDGLARSEWLERSYGPEIAQAFKQIKNAADPGGLFNPGKIVDPPPMDKNLRFSSPYVANVWSPAFKYSKDLNQLEGLQLAIEQCNGAGVCRKTEGVMCPSFQASQEEMHSTRGRANLLRAMISGRFPSTAQAEQTVREALDLCLACKGCKSECPSGVDMAQLKYDFINQYYKDHRRPLRDYLFGFIGYVARAGNIFAPIVNPVMGSTIFRNSSEVLMGLSSKRAFPKFSNQALGVKWKKHPANKQNGHGEDVFFLSDPFTEYFYPENGLAVLELLSAAGCRIVILPVLGAGRTLISKGFLEAAEKHVKYFLSMINLLDPEQKIPIVGSEPSEIYSLRDEYLLLGHDDNLARSLADRAYTIEEYLLRPGVQGKPRIESLKFQAQGNAQPRVLFHGHCYQKAQPPSGDGLPNGVEASIKLLRYAGYHVELIEDGCCGMAGAFGYEKDHYDFSMKVGEISLFPAIRNAISRDEQTIISTPGISCHSQIKDGTGQVSLHPAQLAAKNLIRE